MSRSGAMEGGSVRGRARGRAITTPSSVAGRAVSANDTPSQFGDDTDGMDSLPCSASAMGDGGSVVSDGSSSNTLRGPGESTTSSMKGEAGGRAAATSSSVPKAPGSGGGSGTPGSSSKEQTEPSKGLRQTIKSGFNKMGTSGTSFRVLTNYLHMNKTPDFHLHQYRVDFQPDEDDTFRKKVTMRSKEAEIGSYIFDGHMLYTTRPIPMEKRELTVLKDNSSDEVAFKILIKSIGYVLPESPMFLQFYNMVMRKCMIHLEMEELGRHFYDRNSAIKMPEEKLELWPGIVTAIRNHELGTFLCVEITHKVLRMSPVLDIIYQIKHRSRNADECVRLVKEQLVGSIVMTHYNRRTYKVDDVDFATTPNSTFTTKEGTELKYADYYQNRYNTPIRDLDQPMLVSFPKKKDQNKGETGNIYLIPALCNPTGLTDDMRKDYKLMKKLSEHLHMGPQQRKRKLDEFVKKIQASEKVQDEFKQWDIDFNPMYLMAGARNFPLEKIFMGPQDSDPIQGDKTADWTRLLKGRGMLYPKQLSKWILFYPTRDGQGVNDFVETLKIEGRRLNVSVDRPVATVPVQSPHQYVQTIRTELNKRGDDVTFAFIILPTNALKTYSDVKKTCVLDFGIGCQCFLAKNMNKNDPKSKQKLGSICVKVAIQITAKLGGVPWGLKIPVKKLMVLGFDVYHCSERKGHSAGALVSTTDQTLTRYHSTVGFHKDKSELAHNLTASMLKSLQAYRIENDGALPDKVVLFRDGVGEGQINYVLDYEIPRLRQAIEDLYKSKEQLMAKLSVVIVTKKINSRALLQKSGHGGTLTYDNVAPGTVVDNTITLPERYDYFLVAQSVNQGTVSPTNYNVVLDESEFSPDHMQKLSYKLCHLYYNWCGTVAVPAPCQYAHKLAYLTGVALNDEAPQQLATSLWYL